MKNTILTEKDSRLLEEMLLKYGKIVTTGELLEIFASHYSKAAAHNRIQLLSKLGWLKRIKRGLYLIIENLSSRYQTDLSLILISNALNENSYVSLAYALNFYQMFDQHSNTVVAITNKESKKYPLDNILFKFSKVKSSMFFGFSEKLVSGKIAKIADAEKALIDYLYLDKSFSGANLVAEKLSDHSRSLSIQKLQSYAIRTDLTLQRKLGFILDKLGLDHQKLARNVKNRGGFSKFTKESKLFNAKWRIYYDHRIIG